MLYRSVFLLLWLVTFASEAIALNTSKSDKNNSQTNFQGDANAGKMKSEDNRCQECHGLEGNGQGPSNGGLGKFAKLAGQYPHYITKQLRDFRSGDRKHDLMLIMAKSIDEVDSADIAAYFSSQKTMQGDGTGKNPLGENLFVNGDASRNILACSNCHGIDGKGIASPGQTIPIIGGQERAYLQKQLRDWRNGERNNSLDGVMNTSLRQLTDKELRALVDYIAGL
ncbi:MAG: c-type cytochrome [Pseudomonadota bacterium]